MNQSMSITFLTDGEEFHGASPEEQPLGGSETALVQMARALAARGHRVQVFCRCPAPGEYCDVRYRDLGDLVRAACEERWEILVVSRFFAAFDLPLQAGLKVLWNHDTLDAPQRLERCLDQIDLCLVLSNFHAADYVKKLPGLAGKMEQTVNGLDLDLIRFAAGETKPVPGRVTYVSRPERGLKMLLKDIWPQLRRRLPGLRLDLCGYQVKAAPLPPQVRREYQEIEELITASPEVTRLGGLNKPDYYRHLASCSALLYPCLFPEISCIAALEAQALGLPIITSDAYALPQTVRSREFLVPGRPGSPEYVEAFIQRALWALTQGDEARALANRARQDIQARHSWEVIARNWEELFETWLARRNRTQGKALAVALVLNGDLSAAVPERAASEQRTGPLAPPDPDEAGLLAELVRMARKIEASCPEHPRLGVVSHDAGRTARALARDLPFWRVEEITENQVPERRYDLVLIRDRLEREEEPEKFLMRILGRCVQGGFVCLCVASGAWPLLTPGYLDRRHGLGREEIGLLLPERELQARYLPRGLVGSPPERYFAGRWLALAPAEGPPPRALNPMAPWRLVRPAPEAVIREVEHAGLI